MEKIRAALRERKGGHTTTRPVQPNEEGGTAIRRARRKGGDVGSPQVAKNPRIHALQ